MKKALRRTLIIPTLWIIFGSLDTVCAQYTMTSPLEFSRAEISTVAKQQKSVPPNVAFRIDTSLGAQTYQITQEPGGQIRITGGDTTGLMYGGLDVAEALKLGIVKDIPAHVHRPAVMKRGIKFNIPLDLRTPSYSDNSDAAQQNIPEVWSWDFWQTKLDEMARHRYNVLTLWSLHPFPSMVKVPEYPDVALDDVWRTNVAFTDTFSTRGKSMGNKDMFADHHVVKKISIDEKIRFWRDVMQYAHSRGIEVYIFTWNVFTWGTDGKYGITQTQDNPITVAYMRASVREAILTYPHLAGIGITAGENMASRTDETGNEQWLWSTYGEGIRDALNKQPGRPFRLIHRFHWTSIDPVLKVWKEFPGTFEFSYKYSVAHMYSSPAPIFIQEVLPLLPPGVRTWLTVRNDDIYSFRWGDPEYVRAYVNNFPPADKMAGFYMGPDGYIWGREFLSTEPDYPRQLVMQKQWYSFLLWGRMSYDPSISDDHLKKILHSRFPHVPVDQLFEAYATASKIIPQITRFFWRDIDVKWFPEACISNPQRNGFYSVRHFAAGETMPGTGILNIREWRDSIRAGTSISGITPLDVAAALQNYASRTMALKNTLRPTIGDNKELRLTLGDFEAYAHLGNYYAEKILAAVDLAMFDLGDAPQRKDSAIKHLETAISHWKKYAAAATAQYKPARYNRVGRVDLNALIVKAEEDLTVAREWQPNSLTAKGLFK